MKNLQWLLPLLALAQFAHAGAPPPDCTPQHGVSFICGLQDAEDLVQLPDTPWIVTSAHADDAYFYLVDSRSREWRNLPFAASHDPAFANCAAPPVPATFRSHGLDVLSLGNGRSRLHVVGHGAREAIEVFDVDTRGAAPTLIWRGCIPMPAGHEGNSVASFADGSLVTTILLRPGTTFVDSLARKPTGIVLAWSPGAAGFEPIAGTELPGNNGIEVAPDGREIHVVSSGLQTVVTFSRGNPARQLRSSRALPFTPDNIRFGADGRLYTAGMANDVPACGGTPGPSHDLSKLATCSRGTIAVALDPATLADEVILETPPLAGFSNATLLLPVGDSYFLGSFAADRIATGSLRKP